MQPFSDIRVIDLTHIIAGPFCTYQLAVLGADVIKVEAPGAPDLARQSSPPQGPEQASLGADFMAQNANKRAVAVDVKSRAGRRILERLLATADVLVENYRPGALAACGLGYRRARTIRPDIIYCSMSGYGQRGPKGPRTAYDNIIQAHSGLMAASGEVGGGPLKVGPPVLDYGSGLYAAFAITAALYQRSHSGLGQYIDVAMLDVAWMLMGASITHLHRFGAAPPRSGNSSPHHPGYGCYPTKRGQLMLGAYSGVQVKNMWAVLGDSAHGEALATLTPAAMADHYQRDRPRIAERLRTRTARQWETAFVRRRVPAARVRALDEALADPQRRHRKVLQTPPGADMALPTAAFTYARGGPALHSPPPRPGQHTWEVLEEIGYGEEELQQLCARGVIGIAAERDGP